MNYFKLLCFTWAAAGIITRILIMFLGVSWREWELGKAYSEHKPRWIYVVGIAAFFLVAFTWYKVFTSDVRYSWIIAVIVSLTLIKISAMLFRYERFRAFVMDVLNDRKKLTVLNVVVLLFSIGFLMLGVYLY